MNTTSDPLQGNYVGVIFIGCIMVAFLYGITIAQGCMLWTRNSTDTLALRLLILLLWLNDGAHYAVAVWSVYHTAISDRNNVKGIIYNSAWCFRSIIFLSGLMHIGIKSIYIFRAWTLSKSKIILVILIGATLMTFSLSMTIAFSLPHENNLITLLDSVSREIYASLVSLAFSDVAVSLTVCWTLARCRTVSRRTEHIIRVLMLYTIECGLLMSVSSIACVIAYATLMPGNAAFLAIFFIIPKLGINSLLAVLNARYTLQESANSAIGFYDSIMLSKLETRSRSWRDRLGMKRSENCHIVINVENEVNARRHDREPAADNAHRPA
ncbi:uncharacterized protein C8Q71DRAFT_226430 [Rhodofomes roseus]|uniref:DUF6534 domain-containing protein n=1 Tax=Rhodofomes roseus TaxID=34475 RepID=A0ABQ8KUZ9_9APHY|nr:uncharacterized protein C8Q71DRAFT_226430 [Rhodofomes roseus]KAH9842897.1 hypothetical protein C8Q71DRAFT_226430 [Rhodofomes roseus]